MKRAFIGSCLALALVLSGCQRDPGTAGPDAGGAADDAPAVGASEAPAAKRLQKADPATPDDAYVLLESGNQIMFLYYALAGTPPDYEAMAHSYSREYRGAKDAFRKQDILNAIKPQIDGGVAAAKTQRYFRYEIGQVGLQHYDFASKSFALTSMGGEYSWGIDDNQQYKVEFSNGATFGRLPVEDEVQARVIEKAVDTNSKLKLVVYGYANGVDLNNWFVKVEVVRLVLLDAQGNVLAQSQ